MLSQKTLERLEGKSLPGLFSVHLENHYKLPPMAAKTLCSDALLWRDLLEPRSRGDGQIVYHVVKLGQPAARPVKDCEKVSVRLTILDSHDALRRRETGLRTLEMLVMERIGGGKTSAPAARSFVLSRSGYADIFS
ncbi:MAG: DUF1670 domain-containing protein [bacterium]